MFDIDGNTRNVFYKTDYLNFSCVDEDVITSKFRSIKVNKDPDMTVSPGKLVPLANVVLSLYFTSIPNQCISSIFPHDMIMLNLTLFTRGKIN